MIVTSDDASARTNRWIAIVLSICLILAFMPIGGKGSAVSETASVSRVTEVLFLGLATICSLILRGRRRRPPLTPSAMFLITIITMFVLWAMMTSLNGPLILIGLFKAIELLLVCFIAGEIAVSKQDIADIGTISTSMVLAVFICANVISVGNPLPLINIQDSETGWLDPNIRPRLILGANHPLASALLLALGLIFCFNTKYTLPLKFTILALFGWLLHLCDARGIECGCIIGLTLCLFLKLPQSPYKHFFLVCIFSVFLFTVVGLITSIGLNNLIVNFAGSDAFTLNSRVDVWSYALSLVPDHVFGVGYFSTRIYLLVEFPFAGHAHNSAVEVLLSTGIIGFTFFVLFLLLWLYLIVTTADALLLGISPILLFEGSLNPILFTPNVGMFLMLTVMLNVSFVTEKRNSVLSIGLRAK